MQITISWQFKRQIKNMKKTKDMTLGQRRAIAKKWKTNQVTTHAQKIVMMIKKALGSYIVT